MSEICCQYEFSMGDGGGWGKGEGGTKADFCLPLLNLF